MVWAGPSIAHLVLVVLVLGIQGAVGQVGGGADHRGAVSGPVGGPVGGDGDAPLDLRSLDFRLLLLAFYLFISKLNR